MKVVYISNGLIGPTLHAATRPTELVRYLPCELLECYDEEMIIANAADADVILVTWDSGFIPKGVFWPNVVRESPALVGAFYSDIWHTQDILLQESNSLGMDAHLVSYRAATVKYLPEFVDTMFWCPPSTDAYSYRIPRDIDILLWGWRMGPTYPFRNFAYHKLCAWQEGPVKAVDSTLSVHDVTVMGHVYSCARADSKGMAFYWGHLLKSDGDIAKGVKAWQDSITYGYYGRKLFRLISRAKIVCLGPVGGDALAPAGKYIENAACGAVQVTCDFTDREDLGFEHGKNIWITDEEHFEADLGYLLENPELVEKMSGNAEELVRTKHTRMIRARELYKFLCEKTGKT